MESLAFLHHAVAHDDPAPSARVSLGHIPELSNSLWMPIMGIVAFLAIASTPEEAQAQTVFQRGSRGATVTELQKVLNVPADGIYGPVTEAAVRTYQRSNGLASVDGKAGPETLGALGLTNLARAASPAQPTSGQPKQARVLTPRGSGANVRNAPNGRIVGSFPDGTSVMLSGREQASGRLTWTELADGRWMAKEYLSFTETATGSAVLTSSSGARSAIVKTRTGVGLNQRTSPNGPILRSAPNGSSLTLTGNERSAGTYVWAETTSGTWVAKEFLQFPEGMEGNAIAARPSAASASVAEDAAAAPEVASSAPAENAAAAPSRPDAEASAVTVNPPTAPPSAIAPSPQSPPPSPTELPETPEPQATDAPAQDPAASAEATPAQEFTTAADPRFFKGPQGRFALNADAEKRTNPNGDVVGAIAPTDSVAVTEQRALADGTVWAQLEDGTWIDSSSLNLDAADAGQP